MRAVIIACRSDDYYDGDDDIEDIRVSRKWDKDVEPRENPDERTPASSGKAGKRKSKKQAPTRNNWELDGIARLIAFVRLLAQHTIPAKLTYN
ncbi:hypothetical protein LSTR_LSTR001308 [Laodelphax striatellus]|uniref:Uncharacterized protein n=1 Tax=Laodelphax striatellus TaxID=195883 RepID=A0A482XG49_LAOST|nr:hypothetical protein LSTR_LSTR001308 [Laodelphax striatellus]